MSRFGVSVAALAMGLGGFHATPALAQDEAVSDRVVVTGSRIVRRDFDANSPIMTVRSEDFQNQSGVAVENVLNRMPQFQPQQGGGAGTQFNQSSGDVQPNAENSPGTALLNLRGMGANRSLVLLDGRRAQPVNATLAVDLNTIPSAALRSVEVITGGASSVYGADAVAGVVNFILRDDFEGLNVDTQYGLTEQGGGEEFKVSALWGANIDGGRGNVIVALEHASRSAVYTRDRDFFSAAWNDPTGSGGGMYNAYWAPNYVTGNSPTQAALDQVFGPGVLPLTTNMNFYVNNDNTPDSFLDNTVFSNQFGGVGFNGVVDGRNYQVMRNGTLVANFTDGLQSLPMQRYSAFARGKYEINEHLTVFGQINFAETRTKTINVYSPATSNQSVLVPYGSGVYGASLPVSARTGFDPVTGAPIYNRSVATLPDYLPGGKFGLNCPAVGGCTNSQAFPVPAQLAVLLDSRTNPNESWSLNKTLDFMGQRETNNHSYTYQALFGVEGLIGLRDWTYEVYMSHGRTNAVSMLDSGYASYQRYQAMVQAPNFGRGRVVSGSNGYTSSCTSGLPIFGGDVSQDCIDAIEVIMKHTTDLEQNIVEANFQGGLFELPAGEVRAAFGTSYRENELTFVPDSTNNMHNTAEQVIGLFSASATSGYTEVTEVYGEMLLPVLSDLPLIQQLDLELGYRWSDYNTAGAVDTYKILGDWTVNDYLRLRGGYQVASRAPNIAELFQPPTSNVVGFGPADPCNITTLASWGNVASNPNRAQVQALCSAIINRNEPADSWDSIFDADPDNYTQSGRGFFPFDIAAQQGNPNVGPEQAETITLGAVISSPFANPLLSGLNLSVDWYSIDLSDAIRPIDPVTVYAQCFNADGQTNPTYSINDPGGFCDMIRRNPVSGGRDQVDAPYYNLGAIKTSGVDVHLSYSLNLADAGIANSGSFFSSVTFNWLDKYETQDLPDAPAKDSAGTLADGGQFRYRLTADVGYATGPAMIGLRWRHLPSIKNDDYVDNPATPLQGAGAYHIFDLYGRYELTDRITVRAGIDNLFNRDPEIVGRSTDPANPVNAWGQTSAGYYDPLGRRFFMGVTFDY